MTIQWKRWGMIVLLAGLGMSLTPAWAGNRAMIERRIAELDHLNRQVVGRLPDLPRDGRVAFRGRVSPDGRILEPMAVRRSARELKTVFGDDPVVSLGDAIRDFARQRSRITPHRDANSKGVYTPLAAGIRRRIGAAD